MNSIKTSFSRALKDVLRHVAPLEAVTLGVIEAGDSFSAMDVEAKVDSPSVDTSLKDGYAVCSEDIADARPDRPIHLSVAGTVAAGSVERMKVKSGIAVRVFTGARIPEGADAVVAKEFTEEAESSLRVFADSATGRNILEKASDLAFGERLLRRGDRLTPGLTGLLAAGGIARVAVFRKPDVGVIATGDEVVAPGTPLGEGQLYASNLAALTSWCRIHGIQAFPEIIGDEKKIIAERLTDAAAKRDVIVTSGGSWSGDRDLMVKTLENLGWDQIFHGVRMGPGKGSGFGFLNGKPVFVLPGGPSANWIAFSKLASPALMKMAGRRHPVVPEMPVVLGETVKGRDGWTKFVLGDLSHRDGETVFTPLRGKSRLKSVAAATAILTLPEEVRLFPAGSKVTAAPIF